MTICLKHSDCKTGGFCDKGTCNKYPVLGDPCNKVEGIAACSIGFECDTNTGKCNYSSMLNNKTEKCFFESDCPLDHYCSNKKCIRARGEGSKCNTLAFMLSGIPCIDGLECVPKTDDPLERHGNCRKRCFTNNDCPTGQSCDYLEAKKINNYQICTLDSSKDSREKDTSHLPSSSPTATPSTPFERYVAARRGRSNVSFGIDRDTGIIILASIVLVIALVILIVYFILRKKKNNNDNDKTLYPPSNPSIMLPPTTGVYPTIPASTTLMTPHQQTIPIALYGDTYPNTSHTPPPDYYKEIGNNNNT